MNSRSLILSNPAPRLPFALALLFLCSSCGLYVSPQLRDAQNALQTAITTQDRAAMASALRVIEQLNALRPDQVELLNRTKIAQTLAADLCTAADAGEARKTLAIISRIEALSLPLTSSERQLQARATFTLQTQPEIDLATTTSDVDKLFVLLQRQRDSGLFSPEQSSLLDRAASALKDLHRMRTAKADHDHETVVEASDKVLERFPAHPEARRAFQESGLLFCHLQTAINHLQLLSPAQFQTIHTANFTLATMGSDVPKSLEAIANMGSSLAVAERSLSAAIALDPNFTKCIGIRRVTLAAQDALAIRACALLLQIASGTIDFAETGAVATYNLVNTEFRKPYVRSSPWEIFRDSGASERMTTLFGTCESLARIVSDKSTFLRQLRNETNKELVDATTQYIASASQIVRLLLNTNGISWSDYSDNITKAQTYWSQIHETVRTSQAASESVFDSALKMLGGMASFDCYDKPITKPLLEKRKHLLTDT